MNRINQLMSAFRETGRKAFVAYIVSGDPRPSVTLPAMHALVAEGVDIIELGIPFTDPMAEGPVIQRGHERALAHKVSLSSTLELVEEFRQTDKDTPIVLMGYTNPIERMGYDSFAKRAAEAGVDGVLTVDLPPEESLEFNQTLKTAGIENIFLLAPTTTNARINEIVSKASGFVYYVSLKGVTGAGHIDLSSVKNKVAKIRQMTDLPLCIGFGIKDGDSARAIAEYGDGAVVGSVFVDKMGSLADTSDEEIISAICALARNVREGLDKE
jgi:tryptophan synthase alpha chain